MNGTMAERQDKACAARRPRRPARPDRGAGPADILGAGVVHTLPIVGVMPQHPLAVGGIGAGGSEAAVNLLGQCDCVIKVGATYWPPALTSDSIPALSIDIHPANIGRGFLRTSGWSVMPKQLSLLSFRDSQTSSHEQIGGARWKSRPAIGTNAWRMK